MNLKHRMLASAQALKGLVLAVPCVVLLAGSAGALLALCGAIAAHSGGTGYGDLTYGLVGADGAVAPFAESAAAFRSAISIARLCRTNGDGNSDLLGGHDELPHLLVCYGQFLVRNHHPDEAVKPFDEAIETIDRTTTGGQNLYARALDGKVCSLLMQSKFGEALPIAKQSVKAQLAASGSGSAAYAEALGVAGDVCHELGKLDDAESYYRASLLIFSGAKSTDSSQCVAAERALGETLRQQGKTEEARPYLQHAFAQLEAMQRSKNHKYNLY